MRLWGFHDDHACGYYRIQLPFAELARHGHVIETNCGWSDRCREYPVIVGQRVGRIEALKLWRRLATPGRGLVWETDDDVFSIDPTNASAWLTHTPDVMDAIEFAAHSAHMVTVTNEHLAEVMTRFNDNVVILPNHYDAALLDIERPHRTKVTVGWAGGDSHVKDFRVVADQLRRFLLRNPAVDFHNIGTSYLRAFRLPGRHTGWLQDIFDYYRCIDFDIGIVPLADSTFNASKSGIKAIEFAALGIPVIASDVPAYRGIVLDGVTGYLIRSPYQWASRLRDLVNDPSMRAEMGAKAKEHVSQWTIRQGWPRWEAAYASL